jgi:predicted membrane protein
MEDTSAISPQSQIPEDSRPPRFTGRLVVGLTVIVVGVLFLLDALDVPGIGDVWHVVSRAWPAVFLVIGISKLAESRTSGERLTGVIWAVLGGLWLANNYDLITFNIWRVFWPALLIIFGFSIMTRARGVRFVHRMGGRNGGFSGVADAGARTSAFAIMSGATRRVASPDFQGGDATAVMGGCEIDLRQSNIVTGPATFDVFVLMGGVDLFVPGDWTVRNEGVALLGAIEDNRKETAGNPAKVLIVRGAALMGGIEIKN